ncbi:MAG TPA: hypothetical protein VFA62_08240 [Acidimicrobiia bacterium]|nr:hypothetical protein [Acidimicrobiia bacterium]
MARANPSPAGEDDRILRYAAVIFAIALLVHGADHARRGMDLLTTEVFWAGNVQTAGAVGTLLLVFTRNRWAPLAAVIIGFASAFGFTVVHLLPDWGVFSDAFPGAPAGAEVTAFSWFAALFEIGADLALGLAGLQVLRRRRSAAPHGRGAALDPAA